MPQRRQLVCADAQTLRAATTQEAFTCVEVVKGALRSSVQDLRCEFLVPGSGVQGLHGLRFEAWGSRSRITSGLPVHEFGESSVQQKVEAE